MMASMSKTCGLLDRAFNLHGPGRRFELLCQHRRLVLARAELVVVVVMRHVVVRRHLLGGAERALPNRLQLDACPRVAGGQYGSSQKRTAVYIQVFRSDFGGSDNGCLFDQHTFSLDWEPVYLFR